MIKNLKKYSVGFYNRLFNKFVYKDCKLVLKFKEFKSIENKSIEFVVVSKTNLHVLDHLITFQDLKIIDGLKSLVLSGQICYLGYINGECVFRTLLIKGPSEVEINRLLKISLSDKQVYIHYSETNVNFRNKKIFQCALNLIALNYMEKYDILISVDKNNLYSYKAMLRAGFEIVQTIDFKRYFFIFLLNSMILTKNKISIR